MVVTLVMVTILFIEHSWLSGIVLNKHYIHDVSLHSNSVRADNIVIPIAETRVYREIGIDVS